MSSKHRVFLCRSILFPNGVNWGPSMQDASVVLKRYLFVLKLTIFVFSLIRLFIYHYNLFILHNIYQLICRWYLLPLRRWCENFFWIILLELYVLIFSSNWFYLLSITKINYFKSYFEPSKACLRHCSPHFNPSFVYFCYPFLSFPLVLSSLYEKKRKSMYNWSIEHWILYHIMWLFDYV